MRENFLPIPDAPNYEINSKLVCRNIMTKHLLKLQTPKNKAPYYSLRVTGKKTCIKRSPKLLRRQAVAAASPHTFEPIPSTGGKYEINIRGVVRNAKSKQILKTKSKGACVSLQLDAKKSISRSIKDLLWEVHGIIKPRRFRPRPCSARHSDYGYFTFDNMKDCARFLAPKVFLVVRSIYSHLIKHEQNVFGWSIKYLC